MRDRDYIGRLIDRAKAAGCSALVLTLDLQILGQRHKDLKNGLSTPPKPTLVNIANMATKPRWCWGMLHTKRRQFGNIVGHVTGIQDMSSLSGWTAQQFDPTLSWDDVAWIKDRWGGKLVLKGIMDAEDARLAVRSGADALVVSNHGGRQLDGAPSIIRAAGDRRRGGSRHRSVARRRYSFRTRRHPRARARREGHADRPRVCVRSRRDGRSRRDEVPADHRERARSHDGVLRPDRRAEG